MDGMENRSDLSPRSYQRSPDPVPELVSASALLEVAPLRESCFDRAGRDLELDGF